VGHPLALRLDQGELQQIITAMDAPRSTPVGAA